MPDDVQHTVLYIDPKVIKESVRGQLLEIPEGSAESGGARGEPSYIAKWTELLEVRSANVKPAKNNPEWTVIGVQFQVPPEHDSINAGSTFWQNFNLVYAAIADSKHEYHKMSRFTIRTLLSMLRAMGIQPEGGFDLHEYFSASGGEPATIVGQRCFAVVRHFTDRNGDERQEATKFLPAGE